MMGNVQILVQSPRKAFDVKWTKYGLKRSYSAR
jgi:hypothetical protein